VEVELFHADRQTDEEQADMAKVMVAFCNFANAPNKLDSIILDSRAK
jgi:hypothetical protein